VSHLPRTKPPQFEHSNNQKCCYLHNGLGVTMAERFFVRLRDLEQWIVAIGDEDLLACSRLIVALRTVKEANNLLDGQPEQSATIHALPPKAETPSLEAVQLVALEHGWHIEQEGQKFYLRSVEPMTLHNTGATISSNPTNHLAFFTSLADIRRFLTGE
jgi:hypothetical protein